MTKVILLSAKAQHGKDFTANIMKEKLQNNKKKVLIVHYADLLKYICKTFFNWDGNKDEYGRNILQYVGTDVIKEQYPNYWVDFIKNIIKMFHNEWDYILIPDTRFPNEIETMKECNSFDTYTIRISRPNFTSSLTKEQKEHKSETALDNYKFDYYISNITKEGVENQIDYIIDEISCFPNKKNLFIDMDGTIFNTIECICKLYDNDYKYYSDYEKVDWRDIATWDFTELKAAKPEIINLYFNQERFFDNVNLFSGAKDVIEILNSKYNIIFVSHGYSPNLRLKDLWVKKNFPYAEFIGINLKEYSDKSSVDMKDGIFIDDSSNNLNTSNAKYKICFGKQYPWNFDFQCDNIHNYSCDSWNKIKDLLMLIEMCILG